MKPWDVHKNIGKSVVINPNRDLGMDGEKRRLIGKTCRLIKQCKNGLLQVSDNGAMYSLPMNNVDLAVSLEDIDFDNEEQVKKHRNELVEIPVGVLDSLLNYYYTGGGEPDRKNERLDDVLTRHQRRQ